jgi:hypothetical protein
MTLELAAALEDRNVVTARPEVVWRLADAEPALARHLATVEPLTPALADALGRGVPVQRTWGFGSFGAFVRPDMHARAFYLKLGELAGAKTDACVAIKGAEVAADNFAALVARVRSIYSVLSVGIRGLGHIGIEDWATMNALERFPILEGKVPGAMQLSHGIEEATVAAEVQREHLARHGALAQLPVPLVVYRWPDEIAENVWRHLAPHLSPGASRLTRAMIDEGLAAYAFFFHRVPLRVSHLQVAGAAEPAGYQARIAALGGADAVAAIVDGWVTLGARMLALGYVAADPANLARGYCVMPQNLVAGGGFVDLGGVRRMDTFANPSELAVAIGRSIQSLEQSVSWFLVGDPAGDPGFTRSVPGALPAVWAEIRRVVLAEAADGRAVHPVLREVLGAPDARAFGALHAIYRHAFALGEYRPDLPEAATYRVD